MSKWMGLWHGVALFFSLSVSLRKGDVASVSARKEVWSVYLSVPMKEGGLVSVLVSLGEGRRHGFSICQSQKGRHSLCISLSLRQKEKWPLYLLVPVKEGAAPAAVNPSEGRRRGLCICQHLKRSLSLSVRVKEA